MIEQQRTAKYEAMIARIETAIGAARDEQSGLPARAAEVHGRISPKIRHLLNNLCAFPETVYLECGLFVGASLIAALAANEEHVRRAYGIDDWGKQAPRPFPGKKGRVECQKNIAEHLGSYGDRLTIIDRNLFRVDPEAIREAVTVFYYDADHGRTGEAVLRFADRLADPCVLLLDDWSYSRFRIPEQWEKAQLAAPFRVIRDWRLPSRHRADKELWWCGFYVAVLGRKDNA